MGKDICKCNFQQVHEGPRPLGSKEANKPTRNCTEGLDRHFSLADHTAGQQGHGRRSASLVTTETKIPATEWHRLTPMGVAASKREVTSAGRTWGKGTLVHCRWERRWVQPLWKTVWRLLRKLKMDLPFCPAIPLLGFHLKESQALAWKDSCAPVFPARHLPSQRCRRGHGPDGPGPVVDEEEAVCSDSSTRPVPGKSSNTAEGAGLREASRVRKRPNLVTSLLRGAK